MYRTLSVRKPTSAALGECLGICVFLLCKQRNCDVMGKTEVFPRIRESVLSLFLRAEILPVHDKYL